MSAEPLRVIDGGRVARGWEALWPRDVWFQSELPHGDLASRYRGEETLRFERIRQPWLKEAAERWVRARLLSDTAPRTMSAYLVSVRHFSCWLAEHAPDVTAPAALSRVVLEDYMLWVRHETDWKPATRNQRLLAVRLLLAEQAEDGLAGLPRGAVIHGSELPRVDHGLPKTVAGEVFAQWIDPANLALLGVRDRTLALVLAFTAFRVSSVVTLMRDALERGPDGQPYLRYSAALGFSAQYAARRRSTSTWCRSAVNRASLSSDAIRRTRSSALGALSPALSPGRVLLAAFPLARSLPSTTSATASAVLFGGFAGNTDLSDFRRSCISGLRPWPSLSGPSPDHRDGRSLDLPVLAHGDSAHAQVLRPRRVRKGLAIAPPAMLPSASCNGVSTPTILISRLNSPAYAYPCQRFATALTDSDA